MDQKTGEKLQTLLLVGAGSFLARHFIAKSVFRSGVRLVTTGRTENKSSDQHFKIDVGDSSALTEVIDLVRPTHILNCAGSNQGMLWQMIRYNLGVSCTIFDALTQVRQDKKTRVVLIGSAAEYGIPKCELLDEKHSLNPVSCYGLTKKWQTELGLLHNSERCMVTVARIFNLLGPELPEHLAFGSFIKQIKNFRESGTLLVGNLETARDFLHVDDAVRALDLLLNGKGAGSVYQLASGRAVSIQSLLDRLIKKSAKDIQIQVDPLRFRIADIPSITGSISALTRDTGWEPKKSAEMAIDDMFKY
jgi:GDP-4-dehydro-6-deoxy-D-mannose reductase